MKRKTLFKRLSSAAMALLLSLSALTQGITASAIRDSPLKISLKKTRTLLKMSILTSLSFSITHIQLTEFG